MEKKYKSKYGAKSNITAAQYITELLCEKMAEQRGDDLPDRFWNNKGYYARKFRHEIIQANELLAEYKDEKAIIEALRDSRTWNVKSLRNKKLKYIINEKKQEIERKKIIAEARRMDEEIITDIYTRPRKQVGKPSRISKLRDE